jgi:hypothetical protein
MAIKVNNLRAHVGVQHGAQVHTTLDAVKNKVEMFLVDSGVFVEGQQFVTFVPNGSIASCGLDIESYNASKPKTRASTKGA